MHMGQLSIAGAKMSKTLKNFVTIREALDSGEWTPRRLRLLFMMAGWRGGIEMSRKVKAEVNGWERNVNNFFAHVRALALDARIRQGGQRIKELFREQERVLYQE